MKTLTATLNSETVNLNVPEFIYDQLTELGDPKGGRFAFIKAHCSGVTATGELTNGCLKPTISDILFISNPNYMNYCNRRLEKFQTAELSAVIDGRNMETARFNEFRDKCAKASLDMQAVFNEAKNDLIASAEKSLAGDTESDGFRLGQAICFAHYNGWRLHLYTEKDPDTGLMRPVAAGNGLYSVQSIIVPFYTYRRWYTDSGEWKIVNSKPKTIIKEAIEKWTGLKEWKHFSLTSGNFEYITMNAKRIMGEVAAVAADHAADIDAGFITGIANPMQSLANAANAETELQQGQYQGA